MMTHPKNQLDVLIEEETLLSGEAPDKESRSSEQSFNACLHRRKRPRAALCLSGGGIRSATFSLGVLQGLAKMDAIKRFDFFSTVSGGGFIGSWLSRWIHESQLRGKSIDDVSRSLASDDTESGPIQNLREFSSYLSPQRGLSRDSATLAAIVLRNLILNWLVLIPLLLGLLMIPRLAVAAFGRFSLPYWWGWSLLLLVPIWYVARHRLFGRLTAQMSFLTGALPLAVALVLSCCWEPVWNMFDYLKSDAGAGQIDVGFNNLAIFTVLAIPALLTAFVIIYGLIQGLLSQWLPGNIRERSSRDSAALLLLSAGWLVLSAIVLLGPELLLRLVGFAPAWIAGLGGLAGAAAAMAGFFGRAGDEQPSQAGGWRGWLHSHVLPIAAGAFLLLLAGGMSLTTSKTVSVWAQEDKTVAEDVATATGVTTAPSDRSSRISLYMGAHDEGDADDMEQAPSPEPEDTPGESEELPDPPTEWELKVHSLQETHASVLLSPESGRIVLVGFTALILGSIGLSALFGANRFSLHSLYGNRLIRAYLAAPRSQRNPDPSTGFDPKDNLPISDLGRERPLHIVNAALNLAGGSDKSRQKRKGTSFTFSALHSGSEVTGFLPSKTYTGGRNGISLGKAMTISGAAVSPAMGYHSSKLVGALLTLFNARLGWWLPNPGPAGRSAWGKREPAVGFMPILRELLGRANDKYPFVYVSDGGHFENLGLYEMVRRRCRRIVVVDAGQDADNEFESLSTALRMIRVDFGIDISFDPEDGPFSGRKLKEHYAIGRIGYSTVDGVGAEDGVIIYIKPVLLGDEPIDVAHYAAVRSKAGAEFPHESTADQFFDEAQFESYRKLGLASVKALRRDHPDLDTSEPPHFEPGRTVTIDEEQPESAPEKPSANGESSLASLLGSFSPKDLIAPAVASTAAVSAAVALTVTVVAPESVPLVPPSEPVEISLPTGELPELNLDALSEMLDEGLQATASVAVDTSTLPPDGIKINQTDLDRLEKAVAELESTAVVDKLDEVVSTLGVIDGTLGGIDDKLDGTNGKLDGIDQKLTDGFVGLRNEGGGQ